MNLTMNKWKPKAFLVWILLLQATVYVTTFFNIPVARQIVGFLYLTFVPGLILVRLLRIDKLDTTETILFSVGLSVASLMLIGLITNEFGSLIGILQPLSPASTLTALNGFILIGAILSCLRNGDIELPTVEVHNFSLFSLLLIGLPILSVVGAFWANITGNSSILLFMILMTVVIFALSILSKRFISPKLYTLAIFSIAIALLFHSSLMSNYIHGTDIHAEYYIFKLTQDGAYWNSSAYFTDPRFGRFQTMLGITVLPTMYSNILNMDGTWTLKIVFPLIFSFVPLGLYKMVSTNLDKKTAFISVFLIMSEGTFYTEMLGLARQMVGELFFVLLFVVLLNEKFDSKNRAICFMAFSIALVVSHYALSTIFLFFISMAWLYMHLTKRKSKSLTLTLVGLFFVVMFSWYVYTSASASFNSILLVGNNVYRGLGDFFNPASRGPVVMRGLGLEAVESYWQVPSRVFAYATQFFIVVGFIAFIVRRKKMNLDREFVIFSSLDMVLLAMCILLPRFASTLNMSRFYHIILFFLAPFFVLGCTAFTGFLAKRRTQLYVSILTLIVLVPYFLFQTGFVYEVTGTQSWSVPLSKYRIDRLFLYGSAGYVDERSVFGVQWMSKNIYIRHMQIYADSISRYRVLTSYGMIYEGDINVLSNTTIVATKGTLYLSRLNVVHRKIVGTNYIWNSSELSSLFNDMNKVYSSGGCEIYVSVPHNSS